MYNPSENNKFGFESPEKDYVGKDKQQHTLSLAEYYRISEDYLKDAVSGFKKAASGLKCFIDALGDAETFFVAVADEYERALRNLERLMGAVESLDARLEALEKSESVKTTAFNVYVPAADGWRDLFRERPGFYEWVEAETFEGGRFKAFRADTNGNGDAWRDAELKPVSPPFRWRPLPTPKKARRDDE